MEHQEGAVSVVSEALKLCSLVEKAKGQVHIPTLEELMQQQARLIAETEGLSLNSYSPLSGDAPSPDFLESARVTIDEAVDRMHQLSLLMDTTWKGWTDKALSIEAEMSAQDLQRTLGHLGYSSEVMNLLRRK